MAAEVSSFAFTSDYSVDMLHLFVWCDLAWTGEKLLHIEPLKVVLGKTFQSEEEDLHWLIFFL